MIVETSDGKIVTGWRAWLVFIAMLPVVAVYLLVAVIQVIFATILRQGKWTRDEHGIRWTR